MAVELGQAYRSDFDGFGLGGRSTNYLCEDIFLQKHVYVPNFVEDCYERYGALKATALVGLTIITGFGALCLLYDYLSNIDENNKRKARFFSRLDEFCDQHTMQSNEEQDNAFFIKTDPLNYLMSEDLTGEVMHKKDFLLDLTVVINTWLKKLGVPEAERQRKLKKFSLQVQLKLITPVRVSSWTEDTQWINPWDSTKLVERGYFKSVETCDLLRAIVGKGVTEWRLGDFSTYDFPRAICRRGITEERLGPSAESLKELDKYLDGLRDPFLSIHRQMFDLEAREVSKEKLTSLVSNHGHTVMQMLGPARYETEPEITIMHVGESMIDDRLRDAEIDDALRIELGIRFYASGEEPQAQEIEA